MSGGPSPDKSIDTLIDDIRDVLVNGVDEISDEKIEKFSKALADIVAKRLIKEKDKRKFTLRMSNIGKPCFRQLWLEKNFPEEKEELKYHHILKFLYGDLAEELLFFLADIAGHTVEGQQDVQKLEGIKGHRDAVIDGVVVDAKSASTFSFKKFKDGLTKETDPFGYLTQLQSYMEAGKDDPLVTDKTRGAFLVLDKQHGHITLDVHQKQEYDWAAAYKQRKDAIESDQPPPRAYEPVPDGYTHKEKGFIANGNELLGMNCSYCAMKFKCHDNIRVFLSSKGPKFFTKVEKEPKMPEITRRELAEQEE